MTELPNSYAFSCKVLIRLPYIAEVDLQIVLKPDLAE